MPQTPPPGFYLDPDDPSRDRWWDGSAWAGWARPVSVPDALPALAAPSSVAEHATEHGAGTVPAAGRGSIDLVETTDSWLRARYHARVRLAVVPLVIAASLAAVFVLAFLLHDAFGVWHIASIKLGIGFIYLEIGWLNDRFPYSVSAALSKTPGRVLIPVGSLLNADAVRFHPDRRGYWLEKVSAAPMPESEAASRRYRGLSTLRIDRVGIAQGYSWQVSVPGRQTFEGDIYAVAYFLNSYLEEMGIADPAGLS